MEFLSDMGVFCEKFIPLAVVAATTAVFVETMQMLYEYILIVTFM